MNDQELITAVRRSVHGVRMNVPADQIVSRSRAIRASGHRRLAACVTAVAAVGSAVLALGLSGALAAAPNNATGPTQATGTIGSAGTIRTAAFTLTRNTNGTDTLTLTNSQMFDPAVLQRALAQDGIPALVKTGTFCWSSPAAPDPVGAGVLSVRPPGGSPHGNVRAISSPNPAEVKQIVARTVTVINPAAVPSGTELFFGYSTSRHALFLGLIYTSSYTCGTTPPPGGPASS